MTLKNHSKPRKNRSPDIFIARGEITSVISTRPATMQPSTTFTFRMVDPGNRTHRIEMWNGSRGILGISRFRAHPTREGKKLDSKILPPSRISVSISVNHPRDSWSASSNTFSSSRLLIILSPFLFFFSSFAHMHIHAPSLFRLSGLSLHNTVFYVLYLWLLFIR